MVEYHEFIFDSWQLMVDTCMGHMPFLLPNAEIENNAQKFGNYCGYIALIIKGCFLHIGVVIEYYG